MYRHMYIYICDTNIYVYIYMYIYIYVYIVCIYIITQKCDVKLVLLQASVSRLSKKGLPPNRPPRV